VNRNNIILSVFGGACIALFAGVSALVGHQYLSPLIFSIGIILIIHFGLSLITRDCPLGYPANSVVTTLIFNVAAACMVGCAFIGRIEVSMKSDLFESILTGLIIGFVALCNRYKGIYTLPLTLMLMYAFVYLKLPHCVVYGFYFPLCKAAVGTKFVCLAYAVAGNIIGGLLIHWFDTVIREVKRGG
jgi:formate/nitrite transporter FocA (FNT family)